MRQNKDQLEFKNVLSSLRNYNLDLNQAKLLQRFLWDEIRSTYANNFVQILSNDGLFVFPTHYDEWNKKLNILELNKQHPIAKITAISKGLHGKSTSEKA